MSNAIIYQKIKKVLISCKTHDQLKVAREMLDNMVFKGYDEYCSEYVKDLRKIYHKKWDEIEDIEDKELLEKMNVEIENKEMSSTCPSS